MGLVLLLSLFLQTATTPPVVYLVTLEDEPITPASVRFITRALKEASQARASCLVVQLDTPGGLVKSTRQLVRRFLQSPIPVVVYVAPTGARAASAGVFITLAAHVAAMAPGTYIGAAHPVMLGGSAPAEPDTGTVDPLSEKILNDAIAWARALARLRGRNAAWAARAVRESQTLTAEEAHTLGVIDILAPDVQALLDTLNGRTPSLNGHPVTLRTHGASLHVVEPWWGERLLAALADPNVAFLLLILGFYGLLFEFYTPGWGIPGTLGAIALMLGFYGLSILPINYVGLALLLLGLILLVAEAVVPGFGLLTLGGIVAIILGGLMLVESPMGFPGLSPTLLIPVALASGIISLFLIHHVWKAQRQPSHMGDADIIGVRARAGEDFTREGSLYRGYVFVHGEWWKAVSPQPIHRNQMVCILARHDLTLHVEPCEPNPASP